MSAESHRTKKRSRQSPVGESKPVRSAIAGGFAASSASRGRTERTAGVVAGAALVVYLAAAVVHRWGADWQPQPLDDGRRNRREPQEDG